MTVARGCIYADHYGVRDDLVEYQDQGEQFFRYTLSPDTETASVTQRANLLNMPVELLMETHHDGPLEPVYQGASIEVDSLILSAVKQAEDGNGYILRLYETAGRQTQGRVILPCMGVDASLSFDPQEIKTLRFSPETGELTEVLITEL